MKNPDRFSGPTKAPERISDVTRRIRSLAVASWALCLGLVFGPVVGRTQSAPVQTVLLRSPLTNVSTVIQPPVGPSGTTTLAAGAFVESEGFTGARCVQADDRITYPIGALGPTFPAAGEVEFWYLPGYAVEDDDVNHVLFSIGDIYGAPRIELRESGSLNLTVVIPGPNGWTNLTVSSDYRRPLWQAGRWVHLRAAWDPAQAEDSLRVLVDSRRVHGMKVPGGWSVTDWGDDVQLNIGSGLAAVSPGVSQGQFPAGGSIRELVVRNGPSQFEELPYEPGGGGGTGGGGGNGGGGVGGEIDPVDPAPIPDPVPITNTVPANLGWNVPQMVPPAPSPLSRNLDLPLTVKEVAGTGVTNFPVSVVVPLPYGHHQDAAGLRVLDPAGIEVPAQFEVLNRHWNKDRSIRHLQVLFNATVGAFSGAGTGTGQAVYRLVSGRTAVPLEPSGGRLEISDAGGVVEFRTAGQTFRVRRSPLSIETPLGNLDGRMLARQGDVDVLQESFRRDPADIQVTVEESGPLRAVVRLAAPTLYLSPTNHVHGWALRLTAFAGKPFLKVDFQLQNSAINRTYSRPLYFESYELALRLPSPAAARAVRSRERADDPAGLGPLWGAGLLAEEEVQVLYRNFEQQWPSGIALDGDGLLRIELWPAWSSQRQGNELSATGLHWLDDMQHTVKEFVLNFGPLGSDSAAVLARQFQFPPVVVLPYAWYSATRVTGDLGGHFPPPPSNLPASDRRLPDYQTYGGRYQPAAPGTPLSTLLGLNRFGLDEMRRIATSMAGDWPYSVNRFLLSGDPADYFYGVDFAMAELNIRPQWLAGYRFGRDYNRIRPSENPYLPDASQPDQVRNWRRFIANGRPKLDVGTTPGAGAYLPSTTPNAYARDDEHSWIYHVDEAYQFSGNPWLRDWLAFMGEFRKTRLNQLDPFPDMSARALGHSLAQAVASYKATGDETLLVSMRNFIHRHFQFVDEATLPAAPFRADTSFLHRVSGGRAYYMGGGGPTTLEAPFQIGFLSRALINFLEELGEPDPYALAIVGGFVNWNHHYANYGFYQDAITVNPDTDGSAMSLVDPSLWLYLKNGDSTLRAHAMRFVNGGWGTPREFASLGPYVDLRRWSGDYNGRLASLAISLPETSATVRIALREGLPDLFVLGPAERDLILESSGDLRSWEEFSRILGRGPTEPVRVQIPAQEQNRFWRLRNP
jgi:hypothetical protein